MTKDVTHKYPKEISKLLNKRTKGRVPREQKRANVIPLYKCESKGEPLNYRAVPLTSIICICVSLKTMDGVPGKK